ncbi:hypothetical protein OIU93_16625 [Paeniglutamicibacter sp. ZC-3]|uniref:hypothetical protein n=1 Tax=Paeniglutamicibacter sp. ZC-3 TaxID=2986919 RepID=UPI0021F7B8EC|nr:hypothetical protein [Paeniglutamicibacter sp. ZC-3]MCV9995912.1 hypothetical protein [Paeniglutamicibacter sp. ZC-3]
METVSLGQGGGPDSAIAVLTAPWPKSISCAKEVTKRKAQEKGEVVVTPVENTIKPPARPARTEAGFIGDRFGDGPTLERPGR